MDILKKFLNNPAFDHLAENIIRFMGTDEAMETMIESELLSKEERTLMRKILRRLMAREPKCFVRNRKEEKENKLLRISGAYLDFEYYARFFRVKRSMRRKSFFC